MSSDDTYDRLIGVPHQHQWFLYAVTSLHGNLWRYGGTGEGGPNEPALAVQRSLEAIEMSFADRPLEQRRAIFTDLTKLNTREEVVRRVLELERSVARPNSTAASQAGRRR